MREQTHKCERGAPFQHDSRHYVEIYCFVEYLMRCSSHRYKVTKKTKRVPGKAGLRFHKNVGLGFKTPKEAIEGDFSPSENFESLLAKSGSRLYIQSALRFKNV